MKQILIFLLAALPLCATAQKKAVSTQYHANQMPEKRVHTLGNDTVLIERFFENGNLESQVWGKDSIKYYFLNGQLAGSLAKPKFESKTDILYGTSDSMTTYKMTDADSYASYTANGKLVSLKQGDTKSTFFPSGKLSSLKKGDTSTFYSFDGKVVRQKNGEDEITYYPSGQIATKKEKNNLYAYWESGKPMRKLANSEGWLYDTSGNVRIRARIDTLSKEHIWVRVLYADGTTKTSYTVDSSKVHADTSFYRSGKIARRSAMIIDSLTKENHRIEYFYSMQTGKLVRTENSKDVTEIAKVNENCMMGVRKSFSKEWSIKPQFDSIFKQSNKFYTCYLAAKCGLYTDKGKEIVPSLYDKIEYLTRISVIDKKKLFVDEDPDLKEFPDYGLDEQDDEQNKNLIFSFKKKGAVGLLNGMGKEIISLKDYKSIVNYDGNHMVVEQGDKLGVVDMKGKVSLPFERARCSCFSAKKHTLAACSG